MDKVTPIDLQDALIQEIETLTKDMSFKQYGLEGKVYGVTAYKQDLPIPQKQESEGTDESGDLFPDENAGESSDEHGVYNFPWAIVKLDTGSTSLPSPAPMYQHVNVIIIIGIYEDANDRSGYWGVMNVMQRIMERFAKQPLLNKRFTAEPVDEKSMFRWSLQDEDTHPFYYGALEMAFNMQSFIREDLYGYA